MSDKEYRLLKAATELLATKGYYGFSMKGLADVAGVAAGTTYLYFKNKQNLIERLHQRNLSLLAEYMFENFDDSQSVYEKFVVIWTNFWRFCMEHPNIILAKYQFDHLPTEIQFEQETRAKEIFARVGMTLAQGVEQGLLKNLPIDILSALSIEPCSNLARKHILNHITVTDNMLVDLINSNWNAIAISPAIGAKDT
jgi:TetR/AcrR family transcriptional repressor of multidrug resistance operon